MIDLCFTYLNSINDTKITFLFVQIPEHFIKKYPIGNGIPLFYINKISHIVVHSKELFLRILNYFFNFAINIRSIQYCSFTVVSE